MLQQYALGYYLRQNLLDFLFKPKYSSAEDCFRDFTAMDLPPIPEADVFLYNRPQQSGQSGGKGKKEFMWLLNNFWLSV